MSKKKKGPDYKVVSVLDVNELLSFAKDRVKSLEEEIKEEKRVEDELKEFIDEVEKHSGHEIHFIGHEKRFGKHLVRFLFEKGGLLEVIVEKPVAMNAHFLDKKDAKKFVKGLKKALDKKIPDHPVKDMFIDSIRVEDGFREDILTVNKWAKIHKIRLKTGIVITLVAVAIAFMIELAKEFFLEKTHQIVPAHSVIVTIVTAVLIAIFYEPLKRKIESFVGRFMDV
ncbi:hypothetical protein GF327_06230 [Candidatus Woesearchaeota archaeon]|nr:hypothetical protein [Candidatus Woesearchaeota archaeon]